MRRTLLLPVIAVLAAAVLPTSATAAAFRFPAVSRDLTQKPTIGPARGPAPKTLKVKDVVVGTGRTARVGDMVTTHYVGVLYRGGREFDASWDRGAPFTFTLGSGEVIAGWDRGIAGMRAGGRRTLVMPARLAYGRAGSPPTIPANAALIFVVDLGRVTR